MFLKYYHLNKGFMYLSQKDSSISIKLFSSTECTSFEEYFIFNDLYMCLFVQYCAYGG